MNPYEPPTTDAVRQSVRLYSPQQVAAAAFLGTPIAAAWLFASNFSALGDRRGRQRALAWGLIGTVAILAVSFVLPERFPNLVLPMAYTMGIRELAKLVHGPAFKSHLAAGGPRQSNWRVLGIGLAGLVIAGSVVLAVAFVLPAD